MKFNLSDFLQLDTKGLLAVNGGFTCGGSSNSPSESSTSESTGNSNGGSTTTVFIPTGPYNGYLSTKHSKGNGFSDKTGHGSSSGSSGGGSCSTPSSSPDSSSGKSNNPNGQGPSTTSSNPGKNSGDKEKKDNTPHVGGTCPGKDGGTHIPPSDDGSGTGEDDGTETPNGGGICGGTGGSGEGEKPDNDGEEITNPDDPIDKTSGSFGQITDGSYADKLTMQYYKNGNIEIGPFYCETPEIAKMHDSEMNGGLLFSQKGCLMTCTAKLISEKSGKIVYLRDINNKVDKDSNGELSYDEIYDGLKLYLGNEYDIEGHWYEGSISKEKFETAASKEDTYVLARAYGDFDGDGKNENHWIVLEGYTTDSEGRMIFSYDGSSDNDALKNRVYVFGDPKANNEFKIDKIETFTFTKNN